MKKPLRKVTLHRETLLQLDPGTMQKAAGGYTPRCQFSDRATCETCEMTCTTNFC